MSAWQTAADAAVLGLVTAAETVTLDGKVYDSLVISADSRPEAIVVAGSSSQNPPADQQYVEAKFPQPGYTEAVEGVFTVWSEVAVLDGDADVTAARARAYAILRDWGRAIADDPSLGGAVDSAWVSEVGCRAQQTANGAKVVLLVGIDCQEFTGA